MIDIISLIKKKNETIINKKMIKKLKKKHIIFNIKQSIKDL